MMKRLPALLASVFLISVWTCAFAQSSLSGTVIADNPQGFTVIACFIDVALSDCDGEKSQYINVNADGTYAFDGLDPGQYLVIAWKDSNGSGDLEEGQDELVYYVDANAEIAIVSPPASNILLQAGEVNVDEVQSNPLTQTPSQNTLPASNPLTATNPPTATDSSIVGKWFAGSASSISYYNSVTGEWAAPSGAGYSYIFGSDGSYTYSLLVQSSLYNCTTSFFAYQEGTYQVQDSLLTLTPKVRKGKGEDNCTASNNYEKDTPLETEYYFFQLGQDGESLGEMLELTTLRLGAAGALEVDPEDSTPLVLRRENP
jgi:uncharacterized protein (DUF2141 family)